MVVVAVQTESNESLLKKGNYENTRALNCHEISG